MIPKADIEVGVHLKLKGYYRLWVVNADTGSVRELAAFENLIVNQGLDLMGNGVAVMGANFSQVVGCCIVGTGTTPEAPTDTTIGTFLAGTKTSSPSGLPTTYSYQSSTAPFYTLSTTTWQFGVGVAAGNLTEIAMCGVTSTGTNATPNAGSPAFSRTLIRSGGVPITITILANEILNVAYTIQMFVPTTPFTGTFSLNINGTPTTFNYSILPSFVQTTGFTWGWPNGFGFQVAASNSVGNPAANAYQASTFVPAPSPYTTQPSGINFQYGSSVATTGAYTLGTYSKTFQYVFNVGDANYASGIGAFQIFLAQPTWQITITPAIMKTNLQVLTMNFAMSWSN